MNIKIHRIVKDQDVPVAFTVKIKGIKYPRGHCNFYFPRDRQKRTAIDMALQDYLLEYIQH
tara:strand:+ start:695 stop:877 length:183 start_codon:yes stop_codon:yes gene_type:complete